MKNNGIPVLTFLAIVLTTGCSRPGLGDFPVDNAERSQTPTANQSKDSQTGDDRGSIDSQPGPTSATDDQHKEPQTDFEEPGSAISTAKQKAQPQPEGSEGAAEDSRETGSAADQQPGADPGSGQTSVGYGEENQANVTSGQQTGPQLGPSNLLQVTEPSLKEIDTGGRNFFTTGVNLGEGAELIPASGPSNSFQGYSTTSIVADLKLTKEVRRFHTFVDYKGGVSFQRDSGVPWHGHTVQQLNASESVSWKKASLLLQDSLRDAPGASFGSNAFGGASSYNLNYGGGAGTSSFYGSNDFAGASPIQHISNTALAQETDLLTARSAISFIGAYTLTHYFDSNSINNQQFSFLAGYTHQLTPLTQISGIYGYQEWRFTGHASTSANTLQLAYQHQLSSRMSVSVGAGPQFITSHTPTEITLGPVQIPVVVTSSQIDLGANATIGYSMQREVLSVNYEHLVTGGSGIFAGSTSDIIGLSVSRPMLHSWTTNFTAGWAGLSSLGNRTSGIPGNSYDYWFVSAAVQRRLNRSLSVVAAYQYNGGTNNSACTATLGCGSGIHTALISLSWHTLPIRSGGGNGRDAGTNLKNSDEHAQQ